MSEPVSISTQLAAPKKAKRRKKHLVRKIIVWLLLLLVLALAGLYVYSKLKSEYTVTYNGYTATTGSISNSLSFSGSMQLVTSATYASSSSATVRAVYVQEGDKVTEGQRLVRLSNGETIKAEFDGKVNTVSVAVGDEVSQNTQLVQVADFSHLKTSIRIDEYDISSVHVGDSCIVTATATEKQFRSTISSINYISSSQGNVAYYTGTVYVDVDETASVYPGMQVTVTVPQEQAENVVILKMDALSFSYENTAFVYKQEEDGTMTEVPVTVGVSNGNYVEIKEGLEDGEEVFVIAKNTQTDAMTSMFSSLFGSQRVNSNRNNNGRNNGGGNNRNGNGFNGGGNFPGSRGGN
ncbi:MAG: HlyD family efflux transporter periplasmic adaptor subunit [Clostridia bacterium]|nr:HlyD family efflux transporter periplasmic adaptor subunit [Clostridia bacterium]